MDRLEILQGKRLVVIQKSVLGAERQGVLKMTNITKAEIASLIDESFSLREFLADTRASIALTTKLCSEGMKMNDGWSYDGMGFLEKVVVRGTREFRLHEFKALFDDVKSWADAFHAKAEKARPILVILGESVPEQQKTIRDVKPDYGTTTDNHDWPENMQKAIEALMSYVDDVERMRSEYCDALELAVEKVGNREAQAATA